MEKISEPVAVICKLLVEQPKRFEIEDIYDPVVLQHLVKVTDRKTGKELFVYDGVGCASVIRADWMNLAEMDKLGSIVAGIARRQREERVEAAKQKERSEWLDAYREDL